MNPKFPNCNNIILPDDNSEMNVANNKNNNKPLVAGTSNHNNQVNNNITNINVQGNSEENTVAMTHLIREIIQINSNANNNN